MKFRCLQLYEKDCGIACIKMLLANFHNDRNYLMIPQNSEDKAYSLLELEEYSNSNGLKTNSYYVDDYSEIKSFPFMCSLNINDNIKHFVIVESIKDNKVFIFDPMVGERIMTFDLFKNLSTNIVLIVESCKKTKCISYSKFSMIGYQTWLIFINSLQIVLLFLISFELNALNINILLYTLCFIGLKIIDSIITIRYLKRFDKNEIYKALNISDDLNKNASDEYLLKKNLFSYFNKFYSSVMISFVLIFILMVNDYKHIIGLVLIFGYILFENYILKRFNEYKLEIIRNLENKNTISSFMKADKLSYNYASFINFMNIIKIIFIISIVFIISLINNDFSYLAYYSIAYLIICLEIKKILSLSKEKLELNKLIQKHTNLFALDK